jgi:hypothetical protein
MWAAVESFALRLRYASQILLDWVKLDEIEYVNGVTAGERDCIEALELRTRSCVSQAGFSTS